MLFVPNLIIPLHLKSFHPQQFLLLFFIFLWETWLHLQALLSWLWKWTLYGLIALCNWFCIYSFRYFPGVRLWFADVSESSVSSIFKEYIQYSYTAEVWNQKYFTSMGRAQQYSTPSLWRWNWQRVPKRLQITIWRRGNTQKNTYNIKNTAKVWNKELMGCLSCLIFCAYFCWGWKKEAICLLLLNQTTDHHLKLVTPKPTRNFH
jgi:hypothetical protein